ncbi:MAG: hypothetical protein JW920_05775 [Deltaproteobacteria bacterium]|nr:hypothetical protein [Deltaproteobacteria bacterium]
MSYNKNNEKGLCSTCKYLSKCVFRSVSAQPVLFCEEFETTEPSRTLRVNNMSPPVNDPAIYRRADVTEQSPAIFKGLCSDCIHRYSCSLSKSESGVWHCEEYM